MSKSTRENGCRVCSDCHGSHHHWMEDMDEDAEWEYSPEPMPVWGCKHCDFTMPYCIDDFDSEEPDEMFEALRKRGETAAAEPVPQTLPLFPDEP